MTGILGRPCRYLRCPGIVTDRDKRYCEQHADEERQEAFERKSRERNKLYDSKWWKRIRKSKLKRNPVCEVCQRREATEVHHLKPAREFPELAFEMENLQSICRSCHARESQREGTEARRRNRNLD